MVADGARRIPCRVICVGVVCRRVSPCRCRTFRSTVWTMSSSGICPVVASRRALASECRSPAASARDSVTLPFHRIQKLPFLLMVVHLSFEDLDWNYPFSASRNPERLPAPHLVHRVFRRRKASTMATMAPRSNPARTNAGWSSFVSLCRRDVLLARGMFGVRLWIETVVGGAG